MIEISQERIIKEQTAKLKAYKNEIERLKYRYYERAKPQGYKNGTSYKDADLIKGSQKEFDIFQIYEEMDKMRELIGISQSLISNAKKILNIQKTLDLIPFTRDKAHFCKNVMNLPPREAAQVMGISLRQTQRLYKQV